MSSAAQSEVKAWEEEITSCAHTNKLEQASSLRLQAAGLAHCSSCELTGNLWLCLTCGALSCGRKQFGGIGGNGHALEHFDATGHPVAVKLGTITPEGAADVYCYACNDARIDNSLTGHLKHFGISVQEQQKTEKSMTELQVEQNLKFDFAMTDEAGNELEPLFGPSLTGMQNLGNSCYLASVMQTVFSLDQFSPRYVLNSGSHPLLCTSDDPATCFECQMGKLADGLLSGRYAVPREPERDATTHTFAGAESDDSKKDGPVFQAGIKPSMFKALVGKNHAEFSTMRQQDADDFFRHLIAQIQTNNRGMLGPDGSAARDPTRFFQFQLEQKLQCDVCKRVKYQTQTQEALSLPVRMQPKPMQDDSTTHKTLNATGAQVTTEYEQVTLEECLDNVTAPDELQFTCPACQASRSATTQTRLASFPDVLVLHAQRFQMVNWVAQKVPVPIKVPFGELSLDRYLSSGKIAEEEELPNDEVVQATGPIFNSDAMAALEGMGFPAIRCQRALLATGNSDAEAAMNWLFAHMEDQDIDAPLPAVEPPSTSASGGPSADLIAGLVDMGFAPSQARKALRLSNNNSEAAVGWLFENTDDPGEDETPVAPGVTSTAIEQAGNTNLPAKYRLHAFISHKGPSVHSGHYVAHIYKAAQGWVLFNDEKVVKAESGMQSAESLSPFAYVYVYQPRRVKGAATRSLQSLLAEMSKAVAGPSSMRQQSAYSQQPALAQESSELGLSSAQLKLREKQKELDGFLKVEQQSAQLALYFEKIAGQTELLLTSGETVAQVASNWGNVFRATNLALASLAAKRKEAGEGESQEGILPEVLVRIPTSEN
ncbi:hypothetical protein E5Q_01129 [Mixia osmundae IAM 14324]|nr:hypothetical protein E5Q_01129 [Mixia osmundae IAM 14324]